MLLGLGMVSAASGCIVIADGGSSSWRDETVKETRTTSVDHVASKAISVRSGNGSVAIHKGGADKVEITAVIRARTQERLEKVVIRADRDASGNLTIDSVFPDNQRKSGEGVSYQVTIPDAVGVTVTSSNGAIDIDSLAGKADLSTSNGAITLTSHAGDAHVQTSNGAIKLRNINGRIDADTSNGKIDIINASGVVVADTSNGSIECELAPSAAGPVDLDTSNGAIHLTVGPAFGGTLEADTSSASINLVNLNLANSKVDRGHASLKFKNEGQKSTIDTSNGAITIKAAS